MLHRNLRNRIAGLLAIPLIFAGTISVFSQQAEPLSSHLLNAQSAIEKKDFKAAKKEIERELADKPDSAEGHFLMGLVYRNQRKFDDAAKSFANATRLRPNFVEAHYIHARSVLDSGHAVTSNSEKLFTGRHKTTFNIDELIAARKEIEWSIEHGVRSSDAHSIAAAVELACVSYRFQGATDDATFQEPSNDIFQKALNNLDEAIKLAKPGQNGVDALKLKADFLRNCLSGTLVKNDSYVKPKFLNSPNAAYTDDAKRNQVTGMILIGIHIDEKGNISDKTLISGLGYGLDESAMKAIEHIKSTPATLNGKPVPVTTFVSVEFALW